MSVITRLREPKERCGGFEVMLTSLLLANLHACAHTVSTHTGSVHAVGTYVAERLSLSRSVALGASVQHAGLSSKVARP